MNLTEAGEQEKYILIQPPEFSLYSLGINTLFGLTYKQVGDIMRRLLFISSLVILFAGLVNFSFATSPRVTAIGMSGASASLDSTVGPGDAVYTVGEFTHPGDTTAVNHVYYNTSTGLDKIRIYYYSASRSSFSVFSFSPEILHR